MGKEFLGLKTKEILICIVLVVMGYFVAKIFSNCNCLHNNDGFSVGGSKCGGPNNLECSGNKSFQDPALTYKCPNGTGVFKGMKKDDCNFPCITYCSDTYSANTDAPLGISGDRGPYCKRKEEVLTPKHKKQCGYAPPPPPDPPSPPPPSLKNISVKCIKKTNDPHGVGTCNLETWKQTGNIHMCKAPGDCAEAIKQCNIECQMPPAPPWPPSPPPPSPVSASNGCCTATGDTSGICTSHESCTTGSWDGALCDNKKEGDICMAACDRMVVDEWKNVICEKVDGKFLNASSVTDKLIKYMTSTDERDINPFSFDDKDRVALGCDYYEKKYPGTNDYCIQVGQGSSACKVNNQKIDPAINPDDYEKYDKICGPLPQLTCADKEGGYCIWRKANLFDPIEETFGDQPGTCSLGCKSGTGPSCLKKDIVVNSDCGKPGNPNPPNNLAWCEDTNEDLIWGDKNKLIENIIGRSQTEYENWFNSGSSDPVRKSS